MIKGVRGIISPSHYIMKKDKILLVRPDGNMACVNEDLLEHLLAKGFKKPEKKKPKAKAKAKK